MLCESAKTFCSAVEDAGYDAMIYFTQYLGYRKYILRQLSDYEFWYAEYEAKPRIVFNFDMWQYSSTGSVNGIGRRRRPEHLFPEKLNVSSLRPRKSAGRREFFLDRRQRRTIIVVHTTMYLQLLFYFSGGVYGHYGTENHQNRA